ncbi:MAG: hypothetical protein EWV66_18850 [Microcystis sp. M_OC_Ca_00000000_C217Col]|nr:MAG: hypothetical protein EWV66_18850 [Microcystis sp. M_OC_Ca_00000000_C217Col]
MCDSKTYRSDNYHNWAIQQWEKVANPLLTCEAVCVIIFAYGIVKCLSGKTFRAILRKKVSV